MPTRTERKEDKIEKKMITNFNQMMEVIEEEGFLPLYKNEISGFSLEERTVLGDWGTGKEGVDPAAWVQKAIREGQVGYGHFFSNGEGFVSEEYFPYLVAYQRGGLDFHEISWLNEDSLAQRVMMLFDDKLLENPEYTAKKIRALLKEDVEEVLIHLQKKTYLCIGDYRGDAVFSKPEHMWGYHYVTSKYGLLDQAFDRIVEKICLVHETATREKVASLLGTGGVSEEMLRSSKGKLKAAVHKGPVTVKTTVPVKKPADMLSPYLKRGRLYPNNLIEDIFEVYQSEDAVYTAVQLDALEMAVSKLETRQIEILRLRYEENQVYEQIAEVYGISKERVRQIVKKSLELLRTYPMQIAYASLMQGGVSRQEERNRIMRQHKRSTKSIELYTRRQVVPPVESLEHKELLKDYNLSSRCAKCLQRHGYLSVGQVLWLMEQDPAFTTIHNFGEKSRRELMELLRELNLVEE